MEHVVLVKLVDILTRNNINLGVPITIKGIEGVELLALLVAQLWKIFLNNLCCHCTDLINAGFTNFLSWA